MTSLEQQRRHRQLRCMDCGQREWEDFVPAPPDEPGGKWICRLCFLKIRRGGTMPELDWRIEDDDLLVANGAGGLNTVYRADGGFWVVVYTPSDNDDPYAARVVGDDLNYPTLPAALAIAEEHHQLGE